MRATPAPATVRPRSTFPTCAAICSPARTTWAARPRAASPPAPRASTAPTLITAQMPAHGHGVSDPAHAHGVSDPSHSHGVNDPPHSHNMNFSTGATTNGGVSLFGFVDNVGAGANVATSQASAT